jgi:N-acetylneuraminic acid mutarotase
MQKDVLQQYDPDTDAWTLKAPMPTGRFRLAAAAVKDKIYAIGGYDGGPINRVEEYDPAQDQ